MWRRRSGGWREEKERQRMGSARWPIVCRLPRSAASTLYRVLCSIRIRECVRLRARPWSKARKTLRPFSMIAHQHRRFQHVGPELFVSCVVVVSESQSRGIIGNALYPAGWNVTVSGATRNAVYLASRELDSLGSFLSSSIVQQQHFLLPSSSV